MTRTMTRRPSKPEPVSRWPHRLAWIAACVTLVQIWIGGNVTTYQAGGAVRDWPTTQGYWFYPPALWLTGGWDLFLEQGHRMTGQLVVVLTIAAAVALWRSDRRRLAAAMVAAVVFQFLVGGMRVVGGDVVGWLEAKAAPGLTVLSLLGDDLLLRRIHGCTGPLVLCLAATAVVVTSWRWLEVESPPDAGRLRRLARCLQGNQAVMAGIYAMIILGVLLRHQPMDGGVAGFRVFGWLEPLTFGLAATWFQFWLFLKLLGAGLLTIGLLWLVVDVWRHVRRRVDPCSATIVRCAQLAVVLFCTQLVLAVCVWVTHYNWPAWFSRYVWAVDYTVVQEGRLQVIATTLHATFGSLNLVAALLLTLRSRRSLGP